RSFLNSAALLLLLCTATPRASGEVFLRVTPEPLPPANVLGVSDAVLKWPVKNIEILTQLRSLGYRVFIEAKISELASASRTAHQRGVMGILVDVDLADGAAVERQIQKSKSAYPKLQFRYITPGGKQPQMRSRLVVDRQGVLQVSSPSAQPWLDTNFA